MIPLPRFSKSLHAVAAITLTCTLAAAAYAQTTSETAPAEHAPKHESVSPTVQGVAEALEGLLPSAPVEATPTVVPLSSQIQPTTPWPAIAQTPSDTVPLPQNLLTYTGVTASAQALLRNDYEAWSSFLGTNSRVEALSTTLYKTFGCLEAECDTKRSLLIVEPQTRKVFVAMVDENKVLMRPSLMSWPDASIPTLKQWLSDATKED